MFKTFLFIMFTAACLIGMLVAMDIRDEEWRYGVMGSLFGLWLYTLVIVSK